MVKPKPRNENDNPTPAVPTETPRQETPPPVEVPRPNVDPTQHDEVDTKAALARETQDGKGDGPVPPATFDSFATEGVEEVDTRDAVTEDDIAREVLAGKWGAGEEKRDKLREHGYDPTSIAILVNRRLTGGAPNVFPTSVRDDATSVIRGEWGDEESIIKGNLDRAGKNADAVWAERNQQLGQ